jgi:hypothetical protein
LGGQLFQEDRQTDIHDEANTRFSKFDESTQKLMKTRPVEKENPMRLNIEANTAAENSVNSLCEI